MRNHRWSDRRALVLAAAQLVAFALILRSRGFAAMRSWVAASNIAPTRVTSSLAASPSASSAPSTPTASTASTSALRHHDAVVRTLRAVDRACMYSPVGMRCLARAAIATRLLRAKGFPAAMVIGVHRMPFTAHAWVEMHGAPLYGFIDGERNTTFRVIDRV
jgi:hypothetical protein